MELSETESGSVLLIVTLERIRATDAVVIEIPYSEEVPVTRKGES
jgi:hypothetical protein